MVPHRWWGLAVLMCAISVLAIDVTALNFAIPAITEDLGPSSTQLLWIVDIYAFVLASLLVTLGVAGDRFGRRRILLIGATVFAFASAMAGLAETSEILIAARALQGAAGACFLPPTLSLIRVMFPEPPLRARAVSLWVAIYSLAAAAGPIIGGFLLERWGWGAIFFINVPLCTLVVVGGLWLLPSSKASEPVRFDLIGAFASIVTLFCLVYALKIAAVEGADASVIAAGVVGVAVGWWFIRHLGRSSHPLLDITLLKNPVYLTVVVANGMSMFVYVGVLFYLPQYLQSVRGYEVGAAAWVLVPGLIAGFIATTLTGRVMAFVSARTLLLVGFILGAMGLVILGTGEWTALGFVVMYVGISMIDPVTNDYILTAAPVDRTGAAAAMSETGYELGGALGTAVLGSIVLMVFGWRTAEFPPASRESIAAAHQLLSDPASLAVADAGFTQGVALASWSAAALMAGFALLCYRVLPATASAAS